MKSNKLFVVLLFPLLLILTSGIYRHDQPIEKYLALANEERFNCVGQIVSIKDSKWKETGSFVLIDSITILSAAHCFVEELKKDTVVNIQGKDYKTYISIGKIKRKETEFRFFILNTQLVARSILFHPDYLKDGTCDIAIIKLETPVNGFKSLKINYSSGEIKDTVTGVGFGISGPANRPESVNPYHIKIGGQNIIDSIGGAVLNGKSTMLYADFDSPDKKEGCNRTGDSKPLELEYSIGAGDSGGPLFTYKSNILCLVGIATYAPKNISNLQKNGYYCEINGWTRVSAFADWIKDKK